MAIADKIQASIYGAVILVGLTIAMVVLQRCESECPPEGQILVEAKVWEQMQSVVERPPQVTIDTVIIRDTVVRTIIRSNPTPIYIDSTGAKVYEDSVEMIDDGIDAWVKIRTRGVMEELVWGYRPVYKTIEKEVVIDRPVPIKQMVDRPQRGLFFTGGVGGGPSTAGFSMGLQWQQRNGLTYGMEMIQFDQRYYMVKIGYKIL